MHLIFLFFSVSKSGIFVVHIGEGLSSVCDWGSGKACNGFFFVCLFLREFDTAFKFKKQKLGVED